MVVHINVPDDSVANDRFEPVDAPLKIGYHAATCDALNEALKFRCFEKKQEKIVYVRMIDYEFHYGADSMRFRIFARRSGSTNFGRIM